MTMHSSGLDVGICLNLPLLHYFCCCYDCFWTSDGQISCHWLKRNLSFVFNDASRSAFTEQLQQMALQPFLKSISSWLLSFYFPSPQKTLNSSFFSFALCIAFLWRANLTLASHYMPAHCFCLSSPSLVLYVGILWLGPRGRLLSVS